MFRVMTATRSRAARAPAAGTYARIYAAVQRIPRGKVSTYGRVAALARLPGHARQVGYALFALPGASGVPWQRVVNAQGAISLRKRPGADLTQRMMLEQEGIRFNARGRIDLKRYGWPANGEATRSRRTPPTKKPRKSR